MKLRLISLATLVIFFGQALAFTNTTPVTAAEAAATSYTLYISGSSVANDIILGLFDRNCIGSSVVIFSDASGEYNAYSCRLAATNEWGFSENTVVTVNKRDDQGSGYGVFPVAYNTPIAFLNLAGMPVEGKYPLSNHTADAGISDVEPVMFNPVANRPEPFKAHAPVKESNFGANVTLFSQVLGVVVTPKLYAALKTAQGTSGVPSLSRDYLANFFSQNIGSIGFLPLGVANAGAGVNVCYETKGSGIRNAINAFFGQFPGNPGSSFLPLNNDVATVAAPSDANGDIYIYEAQSSRAVQSCLNRVNAMGVGYGIGVMWLGKGEVPSDYKFVAIDGVVPSRDAAKVGKYGFWFESTIQRNKFSEASAAAQQMLNKIMFTAGHATSLNEMASYRKENGVFALPMVSSRFSSPADDCSVYAGTYPVEGKTAADKFCSRYSREGNSLAVPVFYK